MPRHQTLISRHGRLSAVGDYEIQERFTLRCDLPDGRILRGDGDNFWFNGGFSYYGPAPDGWDESKAYQEAFTRTYETELDYS